MNEIAYSNDYEILTPSGFQPFAGVLKKQSEIIFTLYLSNEVELSCTASHKLSTNLGIKQVDELRDYDLIETNDGYRSITRIVSTPPISCDVYDALEVSGGNLYYTNSIVSHNCRFLGSSNTLISGDALEKLIYQNPIQTNEHYNIYSLPVKDRVYVACVDVGEGVGKDFSTIQIIDITECPYRQVYTYRNNTINPWDFSLVVYNHATAYNTAYLIVENNSIGKIVADECHYTYEYDNMISSHVKDQEEVVSFRGIGVKMTGKTKPIGCSALKSLIENNLLSLIDWGTIQEISCFVKVNKGYEAEKGKHDDMITPLVQFGWLTTQSYFENLTKSGIRTLLQEKRDEDTETGHSIFGFYDDGANDEIADVRGMFGNRYAVR